MSAALSFTLSLFMSFALVPLFMRYADLLGLVDKPDGVRKVHTRIIPRSGGIAIALAALLPLAYLFSDVNELIPLLAGSIVIVIFGLLDDRFELDYKWKFFGQFIAVAIFISGIPELAKLPFNLAGLPEWFTYGVLFVFILGATNAVNLSDGLDGLAAGTILLSLAFVAYIAYEGGIDSIATLSCAVIGSLLGFLRHNTHPASVFMGDTGSQFIGYMTATLAVTVTQYNVTATSPVLPLIIMGLAILDTIMVMSIRISQRKSPFSPDKNHLHHQLIKIGFHHYETVAIIYLLQITLILTAYLLRYATDMELLTSYLVFSISLLGVLYLSQSIGWKRHTHLKKENEFVERRNLILRKLNWVYLYNSQIISTFLGLVWAILIYSNTQNDNSIILLSQITLLIILPIIIFVPRYTTFATRVTAYSASVLSLYPCSIIGNTDTPDHLINIIIFNLVIILAICIRMTRKEHFHLDNQDILVLFMLLVIPLLPINFSVNIDFGIMLLRLAVLIYAIEFLITKSKGNHFLLKIFSITSIFFVAISHQSYL